MKFFMIYQLKKENIDPPHDIRFMPYNWILKKGIKLSYKMYDSVYTSAIACLKNEKDEQLVEDIYTKFNIDIPEDFHGHSLSVSDVVDINGRAFYIDIIGLVELEDFYNE